MYESITPDTDAAKAASASKDMSHDDPPQARSQDVSEDIANATYADAASAPDTAPAADTTPADSATPVPSMGVKVADYANPVPSLPKGAKAAEADATQPVAGKVLVRGVGKGVERGPKNKLFCA
jgi:hypothetical protein